MIGMKLDVPGNSAELRKQYEAINDEVGRAVDFKTNGQVAHYAGPIPGGWRVIDIWESAEKFAAFGEKLMPIIQKHGMPATAPEIWEIENTAAGKSKT
jgi:hypothetical protein